MRLLRVAWSLGICVVAMAAPDSIAQQVVAPSQLPPLQPRTPGRVAFASAEQVAELQKAVLKYRSIVSAGGWPLLPDGTTLRQGDAGANVAILRRQLVVTGDLRGDVHALVFDAGLADSVRRFQLRHGLPPTGVVHDLTRRALNVPAATRLRQLEVNLDRALALLPKLSGRRYLLMNAASFEVQGIADGRVEVASRTIVGKRGTQTPEMSARVESVTLLPYWHVPGGIAKRSVIPAIRKDPSYLYKERIRVFSSYGGEEIDPSQVNWWGPEADRYLFRQDPGPANSLGVIRFDMPNKYVVYLHDTPAKGLYAQFERTYSSGCIRTQSYLDAAEWALAGRGGWTRSAIETGIAEGKSRTIKLAEPIPVHLIYLTAWVEDGVIQFRNDVYNRDKSSLDAGQDAGLKTWVTTVGP